MTKAKQINYGRIFGLFGGVLAALLVYFLFPQNASEVVNAASSKELHSEGIAVVAALAVLMGIWWMSETLPLAITAVLPLFSVMLTAHELLTKIKNNKTLNIAVIIADF